jgi:predicted metalloprotease
MRWVPGTSGQNVEDQRGSSGGFGGGFGRMGIGGVVIIAILSLIFHKNFFSLLSSGSQGQSSAQNGPVTSTPAEDSLKDFVTFVLNDAQEAWARILPQQANTRYQDAHLVLFRDGVQSACGMAQTASGPFYCPGDAKVYIDLGFYDELSRRFGAPGDFAQAYVLAHELGHHVQDLLGTFRQVQTTQGASGGSVRLELQADCYAGIWAYTTKDRNLLDPGDIDEGLKAASAVGDDRIQQMQGQAVNPESWTHGSAAQRADWFRRGFQSGRLADCDTFR